MADWQAKVDAMLDRVERVPHEEELEPAHGRALAQLRGWQLKRLALTYRDLQAIERYAPPTKFFVEELYGPRDRTGLYRSLRRILPLMKRLLPDRALYALAVALELQALSDELDVDLANALLGLNVAIAEMPQSAYAAGYRAMSLSRRDHQLELLTQCGHELDRVVKMPIVLWAVKMARKPAAVAGLMELHNFLEGGLISFGHMKGADEFVAMIAARERAALERIKAGANDPFQSDWVPFG
jgi:hypothetical protein